MQVRQVIVVRLREMIQAFTNRTGQKLTYADLAARSGVARATIESLASRGGYNATLATIDKLCDALDCGLIDLVHHEPTAGQQQQSSQAQSRKPIS